MTDDSTWVSETGYGVDQLGPKPADHPSVGRECPACGIAFAEADYTALVALGPGGSEEARERAREGRAYNAVAVEVHWTCATGMVD